jgi:hypothetical protein
MNKETPSIHTGFRQLVNGMLLTLCFVGSPLLYSYAKNTLYYSVIDMLTALGLFGGAAIIFYLIVYAVFSCFRAKGANGALYTTTTLIVVMLLLLWYVFYGPAQQVVSSLLQFHKEHAGSGDIKNAIGPTKVLLPIILILSGAGLWGIARLSVGAQQRILRLFWVVGIMLIVLPLSELSIRLMAHPHAASQKKIVQGAVSSGTQPSLHQPNIYYIICDAYTSSGVLQRYFSYDNSAWTQTLEARGFFVAARSRCNYTITQMSLCSSLNMDYVSTNGNRYDSHILQQTTMDKIRRNAVAQKLMAHGYAYIPIGHWFFSDFSSKDPHIVYQGGYLRLNSLWQNQLLQTPFKSIVFHFFPFGAGKAHYYNTMLELKQIVHAAHIPGSKFMFAHIVCPHLPLSFLKDGRFVPDAMELEHTMNTSAYQKLIRERYVEQVQFVNSRVGAAVDTIIKNDSSAIIVIQGDHGVWLGSTHGKAESYAANPDFIGQRLPIQYACRVPQAVREQFYDSISPVNTFRILLNYVLDEHEPLLPDNHYIIGYDPAQKEPLQIP